MSDEFARHRLRERGGMPEPETEHEMVRAGRRGCSILPKDDTPEIVEQARRGFSILPPEYHEPPFK